MLVNENLLFQKVKGMIPPDYVTCQEYGAYHCKSN